ncbi:MAG: hypothetical protein R3C05_06140 [Pirellulaceae bacterium]
MRVQLPDHGVFLHWPEPGEQWIHPDDIALATRLIPSTRVLRRFRFDGTYYHLAYGTQRIRIRPVMWLQLEDEGFDMQQWVEVRSIGLSREPYVGQIIDVRYDRRARKVRYSVRRAEMSQPRKYEAHELKSLVDRNVLTTSDFKTNRLPIDADYTSRGQK